MENPNLRPETVNLFNESLYKRIADILEDGTNVHHVFYANYIHYIKMFHHQDLRIGVIGSINTSQLLFDKLIKASLWVSTTLSEDTSIVEYFASKELEIYKSYSEPKALIYTEFIKNNNHKFTCIDKLIHSKHSSNNVTNFSVFVKEQLNTTLIDYQKIDHEIYKFKSFLIEIYARDSIQNNSYFTNLSNKILQNAFDLDFLLNPIQLLSDEQLLIYRKSLRQWLDYMHVQFKKIYIADFDHPVLKYLKDQLIKMIEPHAETMLIKTDVPTTKNTPVESPKNYPDHIFVDYNAYLLFHTFASQSESHPDISFWYRYMNEVEKPKLITALLNEFIPWFNRQAYPLTNISKLRTLSQSDSCERKTYYKIIKDLIYSK